MPTNDPMKKERIANTIGKILVVPKPEKELIKELTEKLAAEGVTPKQAYENINNKYKEVFAKLFKLDKIENVAGKPESRAPRR